MCQTVCVFSGRQDGGRGGRGGPGPGAAGAEDGGPEENLHQVDEQRFLQERGETERDSVSLNVSVNSPPAAVL